MREKPLHKSEFPDTFFFFFFCPLFRDFAADKALEFSICPEADSLQQYSTDIGSNDKTAQETHRSATASETTPTTLGWKEVPTEGRLVWA